LGTIDLSALTAWQQAILVIVQILGSPVTVSWVVVMFRRWAFLYLVRGHDLIPHPRHYFIKHLVDAVERNPGCKRGAEAKNAGTRPANIDDRSTKLTGITQRTKPPLSTGAIRRADDAPQPILSTDWNSGKPSLNAGFTQMISHAS